jgi:hypothetical protein
LVFCSVVSIHGSGEAGLRWLAANSVRNARIAETGKIVL